MEKVIKTNRIKTPRDAKGIRHLKILEKTTQSVFQCHQIQGFNKRQV